MLAVFLLNTVNGSRTNNKAAAQHAARNISKQPDLCRWSGGDLLVMEHGLQPTFDGRNGDVSCKATISGCFTYLSVAVSSAEDPAYRVMSISSLTGTE
ncbi:MULTISPECIES: hypothetical protein [unclassified Brenneria]|uniref:hypothetical protein n=1 Tax=unclassified Brenneria TaxID=2634434 RepID=UPI0018F0CD46|nr:hypothetical protein [Brenneria sp. L3-3C-1]MBJ7221427.1 hypothetical protein [Brenneria sp. L3-3C-1]MEE3642670.1 hypothetical protein [Brenneria sp. L3_3C_1]